MFPSQRSLYELSFLDNDLPLKMLMPLEGFSASFLMHIVKMSNGNEKRTRDTNKPMQEFIKGVCAHMPRETVWTEVGGKNGKYIF